MVSDDVRRKLLGPLADLGRILVSAGADEVFVALPLRSLHVESGRVIAQCARMGVACRYLIDVPDPSRPCTGPRAPGFASMRLEAREPTQWSVAKRGADLVGAVVGLLALAPVFLLIALAIRLTSRGPVFFAQDRYGLDRRAFRMFKFRTMRMDAESLQAQLEHLNEARGPLFKMRNDPRVTCVGRFLRRWSLDELPQLLNVLRGDMTLVGPRPMTRRDVARLTELDALRRFTVPPGVTGLWQVTSRGAFDADDWVDRDLDYIDRWSPVLDLRILARTLPTVLRGTGSV
jgi:lipopolysaccharide/colanic/teichoic acid biosynthesis glycosyltransferase